ncbi:MAG: hypothetical protein ABEN55_00370 [Bradymonadaceae bacterium]
MSDSTLNPFDLRRTHPETPEVYNDVIPVRFRRGLVLYFEERQPPGHFLGAVLDNDLREAIARADSDALDCLERIVMWLENYAPSYAWGGPGAVEEYTSDRTTLTR